MNELSTVEVVGMVAMLAIFAWAIVRLSTRSPGAESLALENAKLKSQILRARVAFFEDGSDGSAASKMVTILLEE